MNTFFTSDLHFGHKNILKFSGRPYSSVEEMDYSLVDNWNSVVGKLDFVYLLGDVSFHNNARTVELLRQLNGRVVLVKGNHDSLNAAIKDQYIEIHNYLERTLFSTSGTRYSVTMCHFPMRIWNKAQHGAWNLHGHSHNTMVPVGKQLDVGVDSAAVLLGEYRPFSIDEVAAIMNERKFVQVDGHVERT